MANRIRGITVEINGDTTGLQESLSKVDKSIKNTQSQLKDVEKLLKLDPTNTELIAQKQRLLGEAIVDTKDRLESLRTASEKAAETKDNYDDWKAKYDPIKKEIDETTEELKKLKEQSKDANKQLSNGKISQEEYDKLQNKVKETSDKLEDLKKSAEDVSKEFGHPISQEQYDAIQREIIETEQELQNLQREAENSRESLVKIGQAGDVLKNVGGKISGVGEALMPVTAGIVGLGTIAVKTGAEFDSAMSQVSAVSGATGEDLEALRSKAREMGSETKFSASEAAEAMNYMAMAGWKTEDMLNGVEGIMNLAAASGEELGTTSDIVTDALTALGYQAQDAGHFADVLAAASSNANTNVSMMGESFQYVAPVAGSMGASAEDLAIALGLMANSGIKASQAGNSLKNGLTNLVRSSEPQIAALKALGLAYTETVQVFDDDAIAKAQEKVDKKTREYENAAIRQKDAVERYGESSSQAQIATNNLEGKLEELHKAQEALTVAQQGTTKEVLTGADAFTDEYGNMKPLREIMDALRSALGAVNVELIDSDGNLREYDDIIAELSQTEEGLTQSEQLKNAAILFGKQNLSGMLAIVNASEEDYEKLTNAIYNCDGTAQGMAETMQDNLEGQLTILMSQLQELAISFAEILMPAIRNIVTKIQELVDKFNALSPHTKETITKAALIVAAIGPLLILIGKLTTGIGGMMTVASKMPAIMTKVKGGFTAVKAAIMGISAPVVAIVAVIAVLTAAFKHLWDTNEDFPNSITAIWEGIKATFERLTSGIVDRLNALGFSFSDITEVIKAVWDGFCNWLAPIFENTFKYIGEILSAAVDVILGIVDFFIGLFTGNWETCWNGIKEIFTGIWDAIKSTIETVLELICNIFGTNWDEFSEAWEAGWNSVKNFFANIWNGIKTFFVNAWNDFQDNFQTGMDIICNTFTTIWTAIKNFFVDIWTAISRAVSVAVNSIKNVVTTVFTAVYDKISAVWNAVYTTIKPLLDAFAYLFETIFEAIKILIGRAMDWISEKIQAIWNAITEFITPILEGIRDFFVIIWETIKNAVGAAMDWISDKIQTIWNAITEFLTSILEGIRDFFESIWTTIYNTITTVWTTIKDFFTSIFETISGIVSNVWNGIKTTISNVMTSIKTNISNIWNSVKSAVSEKITAIKDTIVNGFNNAVNFVKNLASEAGTWGKDIISGIVSGIKSKIDDVANAVKGVADKIRSFLHFSVPDEGPLTDFESWMPDFMQGLADGITTNADVVESTISGFATNITTIIKSIIETALNSILNTVETFMTQVFTHIQTIWNDSKDTINAVLNTISKGVTIGWNTIVNTVKKSLNSIKSNVLTDFNAVKSTVSVATNSVQSVISNAWNGISQNIKSVLNKIKYSISNVWDSLVNQAWDWGYDLMQNLINGINYQMGSLGNIVSDVANMIWEYLHFSVPEKGPLTDFESWMPDFMQGLAKGIESSQKAVEKAISGVAGAMQLTLDSGLNFDLNGISGAFTGSYGTVNNYYQTDNSRTVNQTNNSPKSLSRLEIYRQTRNALGV